MICSLIFAAKTKAWSNFGADKIHRSFASLRMTTLRGGHELRCAQDDSIGNCRLKIELAFL
jgi:hypothetical protein